jgi:hypothetical protein
MQEFTNLYNKVDILLLTNIMENFRDISLKIYKLDPSWYFTTPGFAWDCMLRMTKQPLELIMIRFYLLKKEFVEVFLNVVTGILKQITNIRAENTMKIKNLFSLNT